MIHPETMLMSSEIKDVEEWFRIRRRFKVVSQLPYLWNPFVLNFNCVDKSELMEIWEKDFQNWGEIISIEEIGPASMAPYLHS